MTARLLLLLPFAAIPLAAQTKADHVAVYATYSPTRVEFPRLLPSGIYGQWLQTPGFGVSIKLGTSSDVVVSLDLRGSVKPGTPGFDTASAAIKFAAPPVHTRYHFYAQGGLGYLSTRQLTNVAYGDPIPIYQQHDENFLPINFLAGLDYTLTRHLDYRVVEGGIGIAPKISLFGGGSIAVTYPLSTGLVARF